MIVTITTVKAKGSAMRVGMPWLSSQASARSAIVAPLKAPAMMPTRVIPICRADSIQPGSRDDVGEIVAIMLHKFLRGILPPSAGFLGHQ